MHDFVKEAERGRFGQQLSGAVSGVNGFADEWTVTLSPYRSRERRCLVSISLIPGHNAHPRAVCWCIRRLPDHADG